MSKKKAKRRRLPYIAAAASAALLLCVGSLTAYFTDVEVKNNVITIGRTGLELTEPGYPEEQTIVPGSVVPKDPTLTNAGSIPEYVFMKVEVPKENVTLLYEENTTVGGTERKKGTPKYEGESRKSVQQIFKLLTNEAGTSVGVPGEKDVVFDYHADDTTGGWVLLTDKCDFSDTSRDVYVFGYSKRLEAGESTKTLFDKVQLKSFIEGEITAADPGTDPITETIMITGMSIQTKHLGIEGVADDGTTEEPGAEKLLEIYKIVERKAAQSHD